MTAPVSQSSSGTGELRPCPFCGGEPQFVCGGPGNWYVRCLACGAASDDLMRHVAIERWNTRSSPTPQIAGGVREAIEQCAKIAETVYSRMFPKPSNRITAENAGHVAAAAIRSLSPQAQAGETTALTGAALARWCYDNPNLAAGTIEGLRAPAQGQIDRGALAAAIHKGRWPADRVLARTPFEDEDRNGRDYCFRIADEVLAFLDAPPVAAEPNLGKVGVESLADWFYNEGHEFVVSDEEDVARALLDQFDIAPRRSLSIPSTEDQTPRCEHGAAKGSCTICHMWSQVTSTDIGSGK